MSPNAQRIAIAEACGWRHINDLRKEDGMPTATYDFYVSPSRDGHGYRIQDLPDYLTDLNAMHEAIRTQPADTQWYIFVKLAEVVEADRPAAFGTAEQYAKAFLLALNLWDDSK